MLYDVLLKEMKYSELVHNFHARPPANSSTQIADINLLQAYQFQFFPNVWQLQELKLLNTTGGKESPPDSAETGVFQW